MRVLVDTTVWCLALRRPASKLSPEEVSVRDAWAELVDDDRVLVLGVVRQEVLSGIRDRQQFDKLRDALRAFPDVVIEQDDHERAAELFNMFRSHGVQSSVVDALLCAVARRLDVAIFTLDADFPRYAGLCPLTLFTRTQPQQG